MTLTNIAVCGIGGQGVMTATEILAEAALLLGFDVQKTEVAGMSQRGGVVTLHLRFGAMSDRLSFPADVLRKAVLARFGARKPELLALNCQAFELGRAAVAESAPETA